MSAPEMLPGMFFLREIDGFTGRCVAAAQSFVRGGSQWTHAGLILDRGEMIQGEPGGARIYPAASLLDGKPLLLSDAPIQQFLERGGYTIGDALDRRVERITRELVVEEARKLEHTPYSFLDYLAIGATEWHWPGWQLLRKRVESSGHLICSALVDRAFLRADVHLFNDGRLPGDVTPGDLDKYDAAWRETRELAA